MNIEQTAQQLELAAQIIRTGHPWEFESRKGFWGPPIEHSDVTVAILTGYKIRPVLATPTDNRPLHNPDNLTAEQVGVGYRLALNGELLEDGGEMWTGTAWLKNHGCKYVKEATFRFPLSVPWPEPQPDPYAALKKAHAEGKVIQGCIRGHWIDCPHPTWKYPVNTYREKPDEKKTVPLGPEDVTPGSVFRLIDPVGRTSWLSCAFVMEESAELLQSRSTFNVTFRKLLEEWQINRSIPLTGKWNPDAWEPCHKQIDA